MQKIMGIDTGGTYTDGVILDAKSGTILARVKTPTTHDDYSHCIRSCLGAFSAEERDGLSGVCLSTTLATNAVVEGHGCKVGLLLIGQAPKGILPTGLCRIIPGKTDLLGHISEQLDEERTACAIRELAAEAEVLAISGFASVRNPSLERGAAELARQITELPLVCAHELSGKLGYYERTITAVLNARLIPLICRLMQSVETAMQEFGIHAPLMIVRGDGTLISAERARQTPIDTLLSGPAASITGSVYLSGEENALILDMGGTTTDLATVSDGGIRLRRDGANVGGWLTRACAAEVYTVGLGGDSRFAVSKDGEVTLGPERALPVCRAAAQWPAYAAQLQKLGGQHCAAQACDWEGYALRSAQTQLPTAAVLQQALQQEPQALHQLRKIVPMEELTQLDALVQSGALTRIAFTPTDLLHAMGRLQIWQADASARVLGQIAAVLHMEKDACAAQLAQIVAASMQDAVKQAGIYFDEQAHTQHTIVTVGAPAEAWTDTLARSLGMRRIVPPHADMACAVGAAVGKMQERLTIVIRADHMTQQLVVFAPDARKGFWELEPATQFAMEEGYRVLNERLQDRPHRIVCQTNDTQVDAGIGEQPVFIERELQFTALILQNAQK